MKKLLQDTFELFKDIRNSNVCIKDNNANSMSKEYVLFYFLMKSSGYNGKPNVLKEEDYEKLNLIPVYRGYEKYEYGRNQLIDEDYHYGVGALYGDGIYFTTAKEEAYDYTFPRGISFGQKNHNRVVESKIDAQNVIDFKDLVIIKTYLQSKLKGKETEKQKVVKEYTDKIDEILTFITSIEDKRLGYEFALYLLENYSSIAILLGADGILHQKGGREYLVAIDRRTICVTESTINRFIEGASKEANESEK